MAVSVDALFRDLFFPLYPEDAKNDLARARRTDANPARNPNVVAHLEDAARVFVEMAPAVLGVPTLELDFSDASVHRLSAALTAPRRDRLMADGAPGSADNTLFNFVVHGAAYVGTCIVRSHGGEWAVRRPLWESMVHLVSRAGEADLPVFNWWLNALAALSGGVGTGEAESADDVRSRASLADRYRAYVEVPCARPEDLPVIAPPDRELPKLAKVRYDAFYKYLRARIPELRDVGDAFPSPERFADLDFKSLSFALVGEGRMLVISGPTAHGLHVFWLTKAGFEKSAFWPCDAFPAPVVRVKGDGPDQRIEVILSKDSAPAVIEMLWWGP